jgi:hypothetical protein
MDSMPSLSALLYNHNQNQKQHTMSNLQSSKLKWMDLHPKKRHFIVGSIIDGMVYNSDCVDDVLDLLYTWDKKGLLKSIILPGEEIYFAEEITEEVSEPDNFCQLCNGTGEGCNPDVSCMRCKGSGGLIPITYDYED